MDYYKLKVLNNKRKVIVLVFLIIIILGCYYFFIYQKQDDSIIESAEEIIIDEKNSDDMGSIIVDIKGQVKEPGVYAFNENDNARINDLIIKAGGLLKDADTSTINLSKKLEDEMIIIVYSKTEIANYTKTQDEMKKKLEICENKLKNDACINAKSETNNGKVNINEASVDELSQLSGIGKSKAESIIEYRNKSKFKNIEEIMNVEGIGESIFASIKENITV